MITIGNYEISLAVYAQIGIILSIILMIYNLWKDNQMYDGLTMVDIIANIAESLILGLSWVISFPISFISKMIIKTIVFDQSVIESQIDKEQLEDWQEVTDLMGRNDKDKLDKEKIKEILDIINSKEEKGDDKK